MCILVLAGMLLPCTSYLIKPSPYQQIRSSYDRDLQHGRDGHTNYPFYRGDGGSAETHPPDPGPQRLFKRGNALTVPPRGVNSKYGP